jgi:Peptidase family M23
MSLSPQLRPYLLLFFAFNVFAHTNAQTIFGSLTNAEHQSVGSAWVTLFAQQKYVARVLTNDIGYFEFNGLPNGHYDIVIQQGTVNRTLTGIRAVEGVPLELMMDNLHSDQPSLAAHKTADLGVDLDRFDWWAIPIADGFDFPFETGEKRGYYLGREFGEKDHQGEDWNAAAGDDDLGTPLYAVAEGVVIFSGYGGPGWGNVVRILHNVGTLDNAQLKESIYAHLEETHLNVGDLSVRGQQIGTMGNANGRYKAHLHLEIRDVPGLPLGGGYGALTDFSSPTQFIEANRPNYGDSPLISETEFVEGLSEGNTSKKTN